MKKLIWQAVTTAVVVLSVTSVAQANVDNGCSLKTLRGRYVFTARGFNIVAGIPQPKAILELIDFNGDGTLAVPAATVSINGTIVRPLPSVGSYTVEESCAGTIAFGGPTYDVFVARNGRELWLIQTNPNTVFQGGATLEERARDRD